MPRSGRTEKHLVVGASIRLDNMTWAGGHRRAVFVGANGLIGALAGLVIVLMTRPQAPPNNCGRSEGSGYCTLAYVPDVSAWVYAFSSLVCAAIAATLALLVLMRVSQPRQ